MTSALERHKKESRCGEEGKGDSLQDPGTKGGLGKECRRKNRALELHRKERRGCGGEGDCGGNTSGILALEIL